MASNYYGTEEDDIVDGLTKSGFYPAVGEQQVRRDPGSPSDLKAPRLRIPTAWGAYTVYNSVRNSHLRRSKTYARIQGMIDGNPPYSKSAVKRGGMLASSNVNWRDGEAFIDSVALAYWSLFNDVENICTFTTDIGDPYSNPVIARVVAEEFNRVLRDWPEFQQRMAQHQLDLIKFGSSFMFWPDERDWRFEVADVWRFLVPEKTRNHESAITVAFIEHVMSAQEIWDIIENDKDTNWNKNVLKAILIYAERTQKDKLYTSQYFADLQRRIRNNDVRLDEIYNDDILLVSVFIQEFDGSVSRGIFQPWLPGITTGKAMGDLDEGLYAYFSPNQYSQMSEAFKVFTFTPGEQYIHGNKGVGHRIFNTIEGMTQLDNSLMDAARRSATVLVRGRTGRNRDLRQIQFLHGGFVDVGEAEFVQNLMGANLTSSVQAVQYFRSKMEINNNISGAFMNSPDGKPRTLGEVRFQATKEARVQKNRIAHYYEQLDYFFREVFRKMLHSKSDPVVKLMIERSVARGVPEEFFALTRENEGQNGLPEHLSLKATRASGSGSQVADQIETQTMMQILPTLGEKGRQAVIEDFVAANRGYHYIDRYLPEEDVENSPTDQENLASIENNQLEKGEMVVVSVDNNHFIHCESHIVRLEQIAKAFNEAETAARDSGSQTPQIDAEKFGSYSLEETDVAFQTLGPHFVRHLMLMSQDPTRKDAANSLMRRWAILANFGDKIANNAQENRNKNLRDLQKGQQELDKLDMEERVKMRQVEVDANIKMAKLKADINRGATRDQLQYLVQRMRVSFENEINKARAISNIGTEQAKAAQEIRNEQEKTTGREREALY